jgi:multiple sugar transport system substrate-binding protein
MNKIVKKILAAACLLSTSLSVVACGGSNFGGSYEGEMTQGFWAELAQTTAGTHGSGGLGNNATGDAVINGNPTSAVAYDGSEVTITFYHTMGATLRGILDDWIPVFNEQYPNIKVEHASYGDYPGLRDQITTELSANKSPNLAYCYPDHVALYQKTGLVAQLDDYIASSTMGFTQAEVNEFVRGYYEEGRAYGVDSKLGYAPMYTLPYSKSTEVLYYNKTFFEENNLKVPTTWDEMEEVIKQIKEIDKSSKCIPLGYDSEANWFITMTEQLGTPYTSPEAGKKFQFDVEANHEFVKRLRMWYQLGYLMTEETNGGTYTSSLFTQTNPEEKHAYMCIGSSAGASYQIPAAYTDENNEKVYPFEVGVAMPPQINKENPRVISQGPSLCMFKKANKQEMAATWLFMKFLTTNLGLQANFSSSSGYAPVIKNLDQKVDSYAADFTEAEKNPTEKLQMICVKQCVSQEGAMFVSPAFLGSSGARDQVGILMQNCFVNSPSNGQSEDEFISAEFKKIVDKLIYEFKA